MSGSLEDFFETYIVAPYGCSAFCLCIMADRGVRFVPDKADRNKLHRLLLDLKVKIKIMGMAKVVLHGDVLLHNFVYNESSESLHLVDYDEGAALDNAAPRRPATHGFRLCCIRMRSGKQENLMR